MCGGKCNGFFKRSNTVFLFSQCSLQNLPCHYFGPTAMSLFRTDVCMGGMITCSYTWSNGLVCGNCFCTWGMDGGHDLGLVVICKGYG